jgi:hypothetical protein
MPGALDELRAARDLMARDPGSVRTQLRGLQAKYSSPRYSARQIAVCALYAQGQPLENALQQIIQETADSDDDRAWDERRE